MNKSAYVAARKRLLPVRGEIASLPVTFSIVDGDSSGIPCSALVLSNGDLVVGFDNAKISVFSPDVSFCYHFTIDNGNSKIEKLFRMPGELVLSVDGNKIKVWDFSRTAIKNNTYNANNIGFQFEEKVTSVAVFSNHCVFVGLLNGTIKRVSVQQLLDKSITPGFFGAIHLQADPASCMQVLSKNRILTGHDSGVFTIRLLSEPVSEAEKIVQTFSGHTAAVNCALEISGDRVVTGSDDHTARVWFLGIPADQPGHVQVLEGHKGKVTCLAMHPDGNKIITGSADTTIRIWNLHVEPGKSGYVRELKGHGGPVSFVVVLKDKRIATGAEDKSINFWATKQHFEDSFAKTDDPRAYTLEAYQILFGKGAFIRWFEKFVQQRKAIIDGKVVKETFDNQGKKIEVRLCDNAEQEIADVLKDWLTKCFTLTIKGRFCKGVLVFKEGLSIDLLAQASCLIEKIKGLETETLGKIELIVFGREMSVADWLVGLQEFIIESAAATDLVGGGGATALSDATSDADPGASADAAEFSGGGGGGGGSKED